MKTLDNLIEKVLAAGEKLKLDGSDSDIKVLKGIINTNPTSDLELNRYHLDPGGKPYGRNILLNNGKVELVFLSWGPGQICDVHDHGTSCGLVKVVKGSISNIIYSQNKASGEPIHQQEEYLVDEVFVEVSLDSWHQMKNNLDEFTYTLHIYAPPVTDMQVFDKEKKQLITVDGECGAWLSEPERHLKVMDLKK